MASQSAVVPLVDVLEPGRKPGVVDQQVDAPERFEIAAHGLFAADVERERRAAAACRLDFAAERFEPFATPSRRYDVVAFRREPERRGASDARCGPCDQSLFFHPNNVNMFVSPHVGSRPSGGRFAPGCFRSRRVPCPYPPPDPACTKRGFQLIGLFRTKIRNNCVSLHKFSSKISSREPRLFHRPPDGAAHPG